MSSRASGRPAVCCAVVGLWVVAVSLGATPAALADEAAGEARLQAHLAAGEFAPAVDLARKAPDARQRDAMLGQVAVAQARAGARQAAVESVALVGDDRQRAHILAQIGQQQPFNQNFNQNFNPNANPGQQGGGQQPDFQSLMDLITTTVEPKTWEAGGGVGTVAPFPTGVWIDARGVLQPLVKEAKDDGLAMLRTAAAARSRQDDARQASRLRKVSLSRLEKHVQLRLAAGKPIDEPAQTLAGLQRIQYVLVYPETGDVVVAGPAGDWTLDAQQRIVSVDGGRPIVRLDDLVVVLRHMMGRADAEFGCLIKPRQKGLAQVQEFLNRWSGRAVKPEGRKAWLDEFRQQIGRQDIELFGLDPRTRAAQVLVEADYRMKLVGMGLEEGVPGVVSYLNLMKLGPGESPPPMGVLRWWFTLNYDAVLTAKDRQTFAIRGQGVQVQSENELLTPKGERVHTGQSEALNAQFAKSFTQHFETLAAKYPVYAELRNLCDLALVAALVREEKLAEQAAWHMAFFCDPQGYPVELGNAPREVESVVNYRVINRGTFVAGVSGGVKIRPASLVRREAVEVERSSRLATGRSTSAPKPAQDDRWWWD